MGEGLNRNRLGKGKFKEVLEEARGSKVGLDFSRLSKKNYERFDPVKVQSDVRDNLNLNFMFEDYDIEFSLGEIDGGVNIEFSPVNDGDLGGTEYWNIPLTSIVLYMGVPTVHTGTINQYYNRYQDNGDPLDLSTRPIAKDSSTFSAVLSNIAAHELVHNLGFLGHTGSGLMQDNPYSEELYDL